MNVTEQFDLDMQDMQHSKPFAIHTIHIALNINISNMLYTVQTLYMYMVM